MMAACLWSTPQAATLLRSVAPALPERADGLYTWSADWRLNMAESKPGRCVAMVAHGGTRLEFHFVGQFGPNETLLRVVSINGAGGEVLLRERLGLTGAGGRGSALAQPGQVKPQHERHTGSAAGHGDEASGADLYQARSGKPGCRRKHRDPHHRFAMRHATFRKCLKATTQLTGNRAQCPISGMTFQVK